MTSRDHLTAFECIRCEVFSIDESLSTAEQHEQMKQHLDIAHPYWDLENIGGDPPTCKANFRRRTCERSECSYAETTELIETKRTDYDSLRITIQRRQLFGVIGSILLFIGVFTPIISLPFVGNMNYFQNGRGDGVIILALAFISLVITLARKYFGLWITGFGSFAVMVFTFVNFQVRMSEIQDDMETSLAGNPFRGIADVAMQSIQMQWGWAILIVGAGFVIAAAAIRDKRSS